MNETLNTVETKKLTVLRGHTSPETAYVVSDYPYGFTLRCQIRYWLETKKGKGTRLVTQTTNPKVAGTVWNKPKASTYSGGFAFLYLDEVGHVQSAVVSYYTNGPEQFDNARARFDFTAEELALIDTLEKVYAKNNPNTWGTWTEKKSADLVS